MTIFLARHGETGSNAARVLQVPEAPLSPRGVAQAERLAARLAAEGVARVLSSDYVRARTTAEEIARATRTPLTLEPLLRERNFGTLRGRPYAELDAALFGPDFLPPGGESWDALYRRVERAWARMLEIARETPGPLAVVSHGLVIRALVFRHASPPPDLAPSLPMGNTALTLLDARPPHAVALYACTAHLDAPEPGDEEAGVA